MTRLSNNLLAFAAALLITAAMFGQTLTVPAQAASTAAPGLVIAA